MNWDEEYWLDSEAEECNIREKARKMGISKDKINDLIRQHPDAFTISRRTLKKLLEDEKNEKISE